MAKQKMKSTVGRRKYILEKLDESGQVNVLELSGQLGVSEVTIRNDLARLEDQKVLIRARGGALKIERVNTDFSLSDKNKINLQQKRLIGIAAARLINEKDTITLDSGTTTNEIIRNLSKEIELTVVTNAINLVNQLSEFPNITIVVPGGVLRKNSMSLVGTNAEESFKNFYSDKLFLATDGIDTTYGISTPNLDEANINRVMIEYSKQVILVTDSSKFRKRCLAFIAPLDKIDTIITDDGILPEDVRRLESLGINIIISR